MTDQREFHKLRRTLTIGYVLSVAVLAGAFALTHHQTRQKLASGFAQASRHSLLSGDLRQAYGALRPALDDGFTAIAIIDARGNHLLDVPDASAVNASRVMRIWSEAPIRSRDAGGAALRVRFAEDPGWSALALPLGALLLLLLFRRVFNEARRRIEHTQCLELTIAGARAERDLAERMAHDIRSPLSALTMTLGRAAPLGPGERRLLELAARRIAEIADDLLVKARPAPSDVNVAELVRRVVSEVIAAHPEGSSVRVKLDVRDTVVRGEAGEISRALANLLTNACEAGARTIRVSTRPDGGGARVVIADDGRGIPETILTQLGHERVTFGKSGHGLGVWTAGELARRSGGSLVFASREGRGTTVKFTLGSLGQHEAAVPDVVVPALLTPTPSLAHS